MHQLNDSLAGALVLLSSQTTQKTARNLAARVVLDQVGPWALPHFRRVFSSQFARMAPDERVELLQSALGEVVLTACRGAFPEGNDERAAHAWCKQVMHNRLLTELRHRRTSIPAPSMTSLETDSPCAAAEVVLDELAAVRTLTNALELQIRRLHRSQNITTILANFRCYLATRLGQSARDQFEPIVANSPKDAFHNTIDRSQERARNVVYQRHRRGRLVAERAFGAVVESNDWSDDLARAATLLGLAIAKTGNDRNKTRREARRAVRFS